MTEPQKRHEALLDALKEDLPTERDEARVRRKLATMGLAVATTIAAADLAKAATAAGVKSASSSAPAAAGLGAAATATTTTKGSTLVAAWAASTTGAKLAVVSVALAAGAYPIVNQWAATPTSIQVSPNTGLASSSSSARAQRPASTGSGVSDLNVAPPIATGAAIEPSSASKAVSLGGTTERRGSATSSPQATDPVSKAPSPKQPSGRASGTKAVGHESTTSTPSTTDLQLSHETTLIERALLASRGKDKDAAARWLNEHERRFPRGVLVKERERLRASLE